MCFFVVFFFFKQKTAYEMRISDWSSDVCSSDLATMQFVFSIGDVPARFYRGEPDEPNTRTLKQTFSELQQLSLRSEEHTSELQSLMRISYAVFCLKKKTIKNK